MLKTALALEASVVVTVLQIISVFKTTQCFLPARAILATVRVAQAFLQWVQVCVALLLHMAIHPLNRETSHSKVDTIMVEVASIATIAWMSATPAEEDQSMATLALFLLMHHLGELLDLLEAIKVHRRDILPFKAVEWVIILSCATILKKALIELRLLRVLQEFLAANGDALHPTLSRHPSLLLHTT